MPSEGEEFYDCSEGHESGNEFGEIIDSTRGGGKLAHEGYLYFKDKQVR